MKDDKQALRDLVGTWRAASKAGDLETVLGLMADDVVFMVPGKPPFGKQAFAEASKAMKGVVIDGVSDILELEVLGGRAWMRSHLRVTVTPPGRSGPELIPSASAPGGKPAVQSGHTLTIFRKKPDGNWVLARDANLLTAEGNN